MCFLITGFPQEVRSEKYDFGRDVKFLTVYKAVSSIIKTTSLDLKKGTGPLKLIKTEWIRPLEIVLGGFGKDDPPVINKLPVEVDIPECLYARGLEKYSTDNERGIGDWSLIPFYFLLRIVEYSIASDKKQLRLFRLKGLLLFKKYKGVNLRQFI